MDKKQMIESGRIIDKLEKEIKLLKAENTKLKEELTELGMTEIIERGKVVDAFVQELNALLKRYR